MRENLSVRLKRSILGRTVRVLILICLSTATVSSFPILTHAQTFHPPKCVGPCITVHHDGTITASGDGQTISAGPSGAKVGDVRIGGGGNYGAAISPGSLQPLFDIRAPELPKCGGDICGALEQLKKDVKQSPGDKIASVRIAAGDTLTTITKANKDTITTLVTAGHDTIATVEKADSDTITTVRKAADDTVRTYVKGWRDTSEQAKRSFGDVVDAAKALDRYQKAETQNSEDVLAHGRDRLKDGKVFDAMWGLGTDKAHGTEKNAAKAAQESKVINGAAQFAASFYGGPAGAAAYAAWYAYEATGDANLAMRAGLLSAVTNYAGGSIQNMPSATATELFEKAAVAGAAGGLATAAAGGDSRAIQSAFLQSGGSVLVQGGIDKADQYIPPETREAITTVRCAAAKDYNCLANSAYLKDAKGAILTNPDGTPRVDPRITDAISAAQCVSARDVDCLSNTTYAKEIKGNFSYDAKGQPQVDPDLISSAQKIGHWVSDGPEDVKAEIKSGINTAGLQAQVNRAISNLPGTKAIPVLGNQWILTSTLGPKSKPGSDTPAVVLTYLGTHQPFYQSSDFRSEPIPSFMIGQQIGQKDFWSCQSYALAVALAFKRDPDFPVTSWSELRNTESGIRAEIISDNGGSVEKISRQNVINGFAKFTHKQYSLIDKPADLVKLGTLIVERTGVSNASQLQNSFPLGPTVKDVLLTSVTRIGKKTYGDGHYIAIFGVDGPPNSQRRYLVMNSAVIMDPKGVDKHYFACTRDLPDNKGPYEAGLNWIPSDEIDFKDFGSALSAMTVEFVPAK